MKLGAIKDLVENMDLTTLRILQDDLENERQLSHPVPGEGAGEQLTHLMAAIWIREQMETKGTDLKTELRNFTARVRDSIS